LLARLAVQTHLKEKIQGASRLVEVPPLDNGAKCENAGDVASGQKLPRVVQFSMSALPPKADFRQDEWRVPWARSGHIGKQLIG
jgi:hypothetical protein